jgi:polyribonucleotide 5'-hydroxyl-kinase
MAPSSALPIGAARVLSEIQPVTVDPSTPGSGLLNAVLALLADTGSPSSDASVIDTPVSGFIVMCVFVVVVRGLCSRGERDRTSLDTKVRKMTILAPNQGTLVGRTAIIGSFEWQEQY